MKENNQEISRRRFAKLGVAALGSVPLMGFNTPIFNAPKDSISVNLFSKHLQFLNYNDMAAAASEIGFDGLDLTLRPKGHVLPERVVDDLPKAAEAMSKYGMLPNMFTTNVWDITDSNIKNS